MRNNKSLWLASQDFERMRTTAMIAQHTVVGFVIMEGYAISLRYEGIHCMLFMRWLVEPLRFKGGGRCPGRAVTQMVSLDNHYNNQHGWTDIRHTTVAGLLFNTN